MKLKDLLFDLNLARTRGEHTKSLNCDELIALLEALDERDVLSTLKSEMGGLDTDVQELLIRMKNEDDPLLRERIESWINDLETIQFMIEGLAGLAEQKLKDRDNAI